MALLYHLGQRRLNRCPWGAAGRTDAAARATVLCPAPGLAVSVSERGFRQELRKREKARKREWNEQSGLSLAVLSVSRFRVLSRFRSSFRALPYRRSPVGRGGISLM